MLIVLVILRGLILKGLILKGVILRWTIRLIVVEVLRWMGANLTIGISPVMNSQIFSLGLLLKVLRRIM